MKIIYLVRHGQTLFNILDRVQGCADSPLTEIGERKAAELGDTFRKHGITFDEAYTSDMGRARQTARLVLSHSANPDLPIIETTALREVAFGMFEGGPNDLMWRQGGSEAGLPELRSDSPDELKIKALDGLKRLDTIHMSENYEDVKERITAILHTFAGSEKTNILAVSHGLYIDCLIYALTHQEYHVTVIPNTSVTQLIYRDGTFEINYIGRTENL
ncbi:histidine phosphatase family protein [Sporolactobacillus sp. THM7-4]|nr:histidine phosphatase family protein [Sporolactobacillus sp. THM7-4]